MYKWKYSQNATELNCIMKKNMLRICVHLQGARKNERKKNCYL